MQSRVQSKSQYRTLSMKMKVQVKGTYICDRGEGTHGFLLVLFL